jgi:hypothetical protein
MKSNKYDILIHEMIYLRTHKNSLLAYCHNENLKTHKTDI